MLRTYSWLILKFWNFYIFCISVNIFFMSGFVTWMFNFYLLLFSSCVTLRLSFFDIFCDFYFVCYCSALIRYCLLRHALCQLSSFDQTSSFHISHHTHLAPHAGLPDIVFDQLDHKEDDGNEWIYLCVKLLCWTCTFKFQWCCQIDVAELNPFLKFTSTHCLLTVRNVSCQSSPCAPHPVPKVSPDDSNPCS